MAMRARQRRQRLIGPEAEARAAKALDRNKRLIEADAVEEAREYRPARFAPTYKPKSKKRRRRGKRARPLSASEIPQQVERLREHFNGVRQKR
jgi:hypothetical protein